VLLVAETVELEATQSGLRGSCAFHPDPTRGLYVHNRRFHCFSCGAGGRDRLVDAAPRSRRGDRGSTSHARRSRRQHRWT